MKQAKLLVFAIAIVLSACSHKKQNEGSIAYSVVYQLPDSLKQYAEYLPKQATVYFKGDSTISIQQTDQESTSVITDSKTGFMRALLKSSDKHFAVNYDKQDQDEDKSGLPVYDYTKTADVKTIANYSASKYILKDKLTGESAEAWFTKDITIIPNSLIAMLDTTLGVPLDFTIKQSGIVVKTTVKEIKFEPVPANIFGTPIGYEFLTYQQFKQLSVQK